MNPDTLSSQADSSSGHHSRCRCVREAELSIDESFDRDVGAAPHLLPGCVQSHRPLEPHLQPRLQLQSEKCYELLLGCLQLGLSLAF